MTWPPPSSRSSWPSRAATRRRSRGGAPLRLRGYVTDWHEVVVERATCRSSTTAGPNNIHAEPTIAAAKAGKHVICEKPLGRDADESYEIWQRVAATGVKHMCAFNYRFVPAVRLARQLIEAGELGEIYHFRGAYLQEWGTIDDRGLALRQGAGRVGSARRPRRARDRPGALPRRRDRGGQRRRRGRSSPGATSTTRSSRRSSSRTARSGRSRRRASPPAARTPSRWEINGSKGSHRLRPRAAERASGAPQRVEAGRGAQGFRNVLVSEADHPFWEHWWPHGHIIGWEHTFVHELHHLLTAIAEDGDVAPHGATFEDGYRAAEVCDAIVRSSREGPQGRGRLQRLSRPAPAPRRGPRRADPPIRPGFTRHERVKSGRTGCPPPGGRNTLAAPRWREPG